MQVVYVVYGRKLYQAECNGIMYYNSVSDCSYCIFAILTNTG